MKNNQKFKIWKSTR